MNERYLGLVDQVSMSILENLAGLEAELSGLEEKEASEVSDALPGILLAIAVQKLAGELPIDELASILRHITAKVEIGDFHKNQVSHSPDPSEKEPCSGGSAAGDEGEGKNYPN
ncbi:MAG: hypothetical protein LBR53_08755 [Deltaproteobacteria bacterium]|jgi:hypothetical protein|nr:hypothetical protein [Deltaproteobacteria bacterium]